MADNGQGASVFRDRRGENPYMPKDSRYATVEQPQGFVGAGEDYAYNGRGTRNPNGSTPTMSFNGRTFPREDPDVTGRRRELQRRGIKGES